MLTEKNDVDFHTVPQNAIWQDKKEELIGFLDLLILIYLDVERNRMLYKLKESFTS